MPALRGQADPCGHPGTARSFRRPDPSGWTTEMNPSCTNVMSLFLTRSGCTRSVAAGVDLARTGEAGVDLTRSVAAALALIGVAADGHRIVTTTTAIRATATPTTPMTIRLVPRLEAFIGEAPAMPR